MGTGVREVGQGLGEGWGLVGCCKEEQVQGRGQGRVGLAVGGGCKGFGSGQVGGRGTGPETEQIQQCSQFHVMP